MARETVPVKPGILLWARRSFGLSQLQAADALGVPLETLRAWETGQQRFTITELRKIASLYKRPLAAILLPEAPPLPPMPKDFRTVEGAPPSYSAETILTIREAQRIQAILHDLLTSEPDLFRKPELLEAAASDDPEEPALRARVAIHVDILAQLRWNSVNQAFNAWRARLQMQGMFCLSKLMPRDDCRGFSLYDPPEPPVIVVNAREVDQAKIFTLFHEYAHLILRQPGICQEDDTIHVERWCNRFAASFLVPADRLGQLARKSVTSVDEVQQLAWRFKVSRHVIALRLVELNLASPDLYQRIKEEAAKREDWKGLTTEAFAGRPQVAVRLTETGFAFAQVVLSALDKGVISTADAATFLDIGPDKFVPLGELVQELVSRYE